MSYNGYANWETWQVATLLDNTQKLQIESLRVARFGNESQFRDFAVKAVIEPLNEAQLGYASEAGVDPDLLDENEVDWDELLTQARDALRDNDYLVQ